MDRRNLLTGRPDNPRWSCGDASIDDSRERFDALRTGWDIWREAKLQRPDASVANREKYRFASSCECLKDEQLETHSAGKISNGWLRR